MKNFVLIVHASLQEDLADCLRDLVSGFSFSTVEGHSRHTENDPMLSARDKVVGYIPRVRVDVLLDDADIAGLIEQIRKISGIKDHGVYWVNDVVEHGRI